MSVNGKTIGMFIVKDSTYNKIMEKVKKDNCKNLSEYFEKIFGGE